MAASDHLNGQQFYHGTDKDLPVGGYVRSAHSLGVSNPISGGAMGSTRNTYFTSDAQDAFAYANDAHMRNGGRDSYDPDKLKVYEVEPAGKFSPDSVHGEGAFKSRSRLRVKGVYSQGVDGFYDRKYDG